MPHFWNIFLLSIAIFLVARLIPTIHVKHFGTAIVVAIVYSIINYFLGGLLRLLTIPFTIITLGLFKFVVNAILLWITDKIVSDFKIDGFGTTLIAAVLIAIFDAILHKIF